MVEDCLYCPHCGSELHADVNAARNIIEVQQSSTLLGGQGPSVQDCPNYNQRWLT
ncbi:MAG: zinc ribbon domain-containing protein [Candidatus Thorarchaeota archaeon]